MAKIDFLTPARNFWPYYISAWLFFPAILICTRYFGILPSKNLLIFLSLSLLAGITPWVPWFQGRISYNANAIWAIYAPLALLALLAIGYALSTT